MDAVNNITHAASRVIWGESEGETGPANGGKSSEEPVSGQMGNVAAGEPYDKGNIETPSNENVSAYATPAGESRNVTSTTGNTTSTARQTSTSHATSGNTATKGDITSLHHDNTAKMGRSSLYNPILPATPGETTSSKFGTESSSKYAEYGVPSSISTDSQAAAQKTLSQRSGVAEDEVGTTSAASANGSRAKAHEEKFTNSGLTGGMKDTGAQKTSTPNGPRLKSTRSRSSSSAAREADRAHQAATRLVSVERTKSVQDNARAKVGSRTSGVGFAASEADYGGGTGAAATNGKAADSSLIKERKPSLKDKIKAKLRRTSMVA